MAKHAGAQTPKNHHRLQHERMEIRKRNELEQLESEMAESPDDIGATWSETQLNKLFRTPTVRQHNTGDGASFVEYKRRVRTKPRCNLQISKPRGHSLAPPIPVNDGVTLRKVRGDDGAWRDAVDRWSTDHLAPPSELCNIVDIYRVEFPQEQYPDHDLFRRAPRNASPSREKDSRVLLPLLLYFDLHRSTEPLQTNWGEIDPQKLFAEEYDRSSPLPDRDPDAELELRPSWQELQARFDTPDIEYASRWVRTAPLLARVGYVSQHRNEMIIPVGGNVLYAETIGSGARIIRLDDPSARRHLPIFRLGDLEFATERHQGGNTPRLGQLLNYSNHPVKDAYGTPKGPQSKGSDPHFWKPLYPRATFTGGLPYDVYSYDELQFGYCFGSKSAAPNDLQPFDDVVQRKLDRTHLRKRLSAKERLVSDMLVWSEHTTKLAGSYADIGEAYLGHPASKRTYHRYGLAAVKWVSRAIADALVSVSADSPRLIKGNAQSWSSVSALHDWQRRPAPANRFHPMLWTIFRPNSVWRLQCCSRATRHAE
ncbi:hypothetical protein ACKWRH_28305 [Bradyrhizobium sp. Pa8]|uniref:hypothetical protein n=1 Tax=Bradyrhizobium sp. Pa8 TaxID=3386552 RepID=UPI00403FBBD4